MSQRKHSAQASKQHSLRGNHKPPTSNIESTRLYQSKQLHNVARTELDELRDSLRYAEFLLQKTRQEKEQVERDLEKHDQHVGEPLRREVAKKDQENR